MFTAVLDTAVRTPIERMTLAELQRTRRQVFPPRRPFTWLTGPVLDTVAISFGTAEARDGYQIPLRIYRPRGVASTGPTLPLVVFYHGGGFVQGNPVGYDPLCTHVSDRVGAVVVSVDYRMAPEHRAPRAALDCVDATAWVTDHAAELGADGSRVGVFGDSAGGNLAAVVAQVFRDQGRTAIDHQGLIYPATDMTMASPSLDEHAHAPVLTRANVTAYRAHYLGTDVSDTDPVVSPLFGRLEGLPPALVITADLDPIRDDGLRYADALDAAGVPVRVTNYAGAPHGFFSFPGAVPAGRQAWAELVDQMHRHLAPEPHATAAPPVGPAHGHDADG